MIRQFAAIVERDGHQYIAYCPGLSLKVIGQSITDAREKLAEAVEVFVNTASEEEIKRRQEVYVTQIELVDDNRRAQHGRGREPEFLNLMRHASVLSGTAIPPVRRRM